MGVKYSSFDEKQQYEDDDIEEEVCVTGKDERLAICETKNQHDIIIQCIGVLRIRHDKHKISTKQCIGTGTVFHVDGNKCLVLTCAHNIRANVYQCENENCNSLKMLKKPQNKQCSKCSNKFVKDNQLHKPTKISFVRRTVTHKDFGVYEDEYECEMKQLIINDQEYQKYPHPTSGNDIAILVINDKKAADYYRDKCKQIFLVDNFELFDSDKRQMNLFGYSGDKKNMKNEKEMWGMSTPNPNNMFCGLNMQTLNLYLINKEIDTASGNSGSSIYCRGDDADTFWICSVHAGGSKKKKENYGSLLDRTKLTWIKESLKEIDIHIGSDKLIQVETKYSALYTGLKEQINTLENDNEAKMIQLKEKQDKIEKYEKTIAKQRETKHHVYRGSRSQLKLVVMILIGLYWKLVFGTQRK